MIVRRLQDLIGTARDVFWGNGQSRRFLLEKDGMGFSLTDTTVLAGTESRLEYTNHMEAAYCIEGEGEIEDAQGNKWIITPGTLYALDKHDKHTVRAKTNMRLICCFTPPLKGQEAHKFDGDPSAY